MTTPTASGLDDVVVAETALSDVDGERGHLIIRGYSIDTIVEHAAFEDVCALVWNGAWPSTAERAGIHARLAKARAEAFEMLPSLGDALRTSDSMDAVRAAVGHLRSGDSTKDRFALTGAIPVFAAAWARARENEPAVAPKPWLSHAADCLQMIGGADPPPPFVRALDAYLCCVADHGLNASTFVARIVASTGSDVVSAIIAALGALKGPLHGGAPAPVLAMLDAIGAAEHARAWLETQAAAGRRIMGMGHRVYHVRDPRADALERALLELESNGLSTDLSLARATEREAQRILEELHPGRNLRANVEFYTAVLLDAIGIPRSLFTPMFAASRVVGWCAHVDEQRAVGRLIRPASAYVGPAPLEAVVN